LVEAKGEQSGDGLRALSLGEDLEDTTNNVESASQLAKSSKDMYKIFTPTFICNFEQLFLALGLPLY
jgi:hypothetical protein